MASPTGIFQVDGVRVMVSPSKLDMGEAAAQHGAAILREVVQRRGRARIIVGTGPSQQETIAALAAAPDVDWTKVEIFHMDEYVAMPASHPASFRRWLKTHLADRVNALRVNYLDGAERDLDGECLRYADLLRAEPIDIAFLGFGENGHIAFNDPHVADFHDPLIVKRVELDDRCRMQQVGEGHFPDLSHVPKEAVTITCPALMDARHLICSVPDRRKAEAVRNALKGPVDETCPASLIRRHASAWVFLDEAAASLL